MELRFSYRSGSLTYIGTGRTRNFSDGAVCFETDQALAEGRELELRIPWPSRLQNVCPLELVVRGPVVSQDATVAVLRVDSYELQTHGDHSFTQTDSCGITCNIAA